MTVGPSSMELPCWLWQPASGTRVRKINQLGYFGDFDGGRAKRAHQPTKPRGRSAALSLAGEEERAAPGRGVGGASRRWRAEPLPNPLPQGERAETRLKALRNLVGVDHAAFTEPVHRRLHFGVIEREAAPAAADAAVSVGHLGST